MKKDSKITYKDAGVDVKRGYEVVDLIKEVIKTTHREEVVSDIGGFGGVFSANKIKEMKNPVLISGTDGVGTKLKLAFLMDLHGSIGKDLVAMSVNDIICAGAEPLFFLDYYASHQTDPKKVSFVVMGIAEACKEAGCALVGGETAEMVGMYKEGEYDLAGFAVGVTEKDRIPVKENIQNGDVIIGLASSGVHSNGFSLVRHVLELDEESVHDKPKGFNKSIGRTLLEPTKIYVTPVLALFEAGIVKGVSHITGGGWFENVPRMLPDGVGVKFKKGSWPIPTIFKYLKEVGDLSDETMWGTFNMGIGMMVCVDKNNVEKAMEILEDVGEEAYIIGQVTTKTEDDAHGIVI